MRGVLNLRGDVLPVIDARIKFGMSKVEFTRNTCVLVVEIHDDEDAEVTKLGVLVDTVKEVLQVRDNEIKSAPQVGNGIESSFLSGLVHKDDRFIMIIDVNLAFANAEIHEIPADILEPEEVEAS